MAPVLQGPYSAGHARGTISFLSHQRGRLCVCCVSACSVCDLGPCLYVMCVVWGLSLYVVMVFVSVWSESLLCVV